ncbi:hypothetical protein Anas_11281 [Armadillidium nasatum]|uniref:Uncharacterized protein n=1 Tax=Armadillidium nasatum TaxID=96803 RepID=A0A5N5TAG9_9CRUS|nr:hypothetical protein Anas_11281 [Armadillidium nasatum]
MSSNINSEDLQELKTSEEGVEVFLFLQNLKNVYNINESIGTYICSKVKNIINNYRHKTKRKIYEDLKANQIVSKKLNEIIDFALQESDFEKLFEYYSDISYADELEENVVPTCCRYIYNKHEKSCLKANLKDRPLSTDDDLDINVKPSPSVSRSKTKISVESKHKKSHLKTLLCEELHIDKEVLSDSTIQYFNKESKTWEEPIVWSSLKPNENVRIILPNETNNFEDQSNTIGEKPSLTFEAEDSTELENGHEYPTDYYIQSILEEYERSGGKLEWIKNFKLPEFDSKLQKKMEEGTAIQAIERTRICQAIVKSLHLMNVTTLASNEVHFILNVMFFTYPKLAESEKNYKMSWNIWKVSIENMFENSKNVNIRTKSRESKSDSKRKSLKESPLPAKRNKSDENCSSNLVASLALSDANVSEASKLEKISAGMDATFQERRMQVVTEQWNIEDIFTSYPWLHHENEIFAEFSRIVQFDWQVDQVIDAGFRKITIPLLNILKNHPKHRAIVDKEKELRSVEKKNKGASNFNYKMTLFALPFAIGEDIETVFKQANSYYEEPIQIEFTGGEHYDNGKSYSVTLENCKIECSNLQKAVAVFFCSFFIFNLAYPSDIKKFLYAIERNILNIPGNAPPPTSVVKLFSKLDEYFMKKEID